MTGKTVICWLHLQQAKSGVKDEQVKIQRAQPMCKQGLLFSGRHILMQTKRDRSRERNNLFMSRQRDFVTAQVKSWGKRRKILMIIYHFIVYVMQKAEKEGFEFCGAGAGKQYLPISMILQTSSKPAALCSAGKFPLYYGCSFCSQSFSCPKVPRSEHFSLVCPTQHLCQQLPVPSQTAWQHLRTSQTHQTPWEFWHLFQQDLGMILKFLSLRCFCKHPVPSWACPKRQILVTSGKHILVPNASPSSQINNVDKQEIWGY